MVLAFQEKHVIHTKVFTFSGQLEGLSNIGIWRRGREGGREGGGTSLGGIDPSSDNWFSNFNEVSYQGLFFGPLIYSSCPVATSLKCSVGCPDLLNVVKLLLAFVANGHPCILNEIQEE